MSNINYLTFEDLFPDEDRQGLNDYLKNIPTSTISSLAAFINARLYAHIRNPKANDDVIKLLFKAFPQSKDKHFKSLLNKFQEIAGGSNFIYIHPFTLLEALKHSINNPSTSNQLGNPYDESKNLLKAILSEQSRMDLRTIPKSQSNIPEILYELIWVSTLGKREFEKRSDVVSRSFMCFYFLKYLNTKKEFKPFVDEFLNKHGIQKPANYVNLIMGLNYECIDIKEKQYTGQLNKTSELLNKIAPLVWDLNDTKQTLSEDYRELRMRPIMKTDDNLYFVSHWNFVIDKLWPGIKFSLFEQTNLNSKYSKLPLFLSDVNYYFSEKVLFLKVMNHLFSGRVDWTSEEDKNAGLLSDYYILKGNDLIIIEFKDSVMPKKRKYIEIKETIDSKMVQKVGVIQLIKRIGELEMTPPLIMDKMESIEMSHLRIIPIIMYTDYSFGTIGVNHYLNNIFRNQLNTSLDVRDLILMDLGIFIRYAKGFEDNEFNLFQMIDTYYDYLEQSRIDWEKVSKGSEYIQLMLSFEDIVVNEQMFEKSYLSETLFKEFLEELG